MFSSTSSKSGGRGEGGAGTASTLPVSSTRAPQKARCVTKLSRLNQRSRKPTDERMKQGKGKKFRGREKWGEKKRQAESRKEEITW
jgi:hypothetical protein